MTISKEERIEIADMLLKLPVVRKNNAGELYEGVKIDDLSAVLGINIGAAEDGMLAISEADVIYLANMIRPNEKLTNWAKFAAALIGTTVDPTVTEFSNYAGSKDWFDDAKNLIELAKDIEL